MKKRSIPSVLGLVAISALGLASVCPAAPVSISGIYPHLTMYNREGECGTGAVVPWAGRLWAITYGPHKPFGSTDKLYEIGDDLQRMIRPESVGGTPANRMIHRESQQLLIGPYLIDTARHVRVIAPSAMPGRLTGVARHLTDPTNKVYYATMEEGLYEVDVHTLAVTGLIKDENQPPANFPPLASSAKVASKLPGYHGKGLYSGQGRVIYANNGEQSAAALVDPTIPSGALAEWTGEGDWRLVRRNQFTEVTGPGGIYGSEHPADDPVWSIGWDFRSLILMTLDRGVWHGYRLPKASHCYDGAHGWNTEWPRIRDIGENDLLMTMHGSFWRFPRNFDATHSAGIAPRSTYLKVIGDFCRWNDRLVFGCDDTALSEFLNKRKAKGALAGPGQSQSNLWFVDPPRVDTFGPALGRGGVWVRDDIKAGAPSDPFLFSGFVHRAAHFAQDGAAAATFSLEVDVRGDGTWTALRKVDVPAHGSAWVAFAPSETGAWIRVTADRDCPKATAFFAYRNDDARGEVSTPLFDGLARPGDAASRGLLLTRSGDQHTLRIAAVDAAGATSCFDMDNALTLHEVVDPAAATVVQKRAAIPEHVLVVDAASVLYADEKGRWRLPKGDASFDGPMPAGGERICREVCTERDLFNAHGTFYELPAENAGGMAKIRPIATHNRRISDYASYCGLLVMTGISTSAPASNPHIVRSDDGRFALWVGAVDDLWQLGKPRGHGGPWKDSAVKAGVPSDPYLMTGYDRKRVALSHTAKEAVDIRLEVDVTGAGLWLPYRTLSVEPGRTVEHAFPDDFSAYWVRAVAARDTTATVQFTYE